MSYSISEGASDAAENALAIKEIAERYPDAHIMELPDGSRVWMSDAITGKDATDFVLAVARRGDGRDERTEVWVCPYLTVRGRSVFVRRDFWIPESSIIVRKDERRRALLKLLLEFR